MCLKNPNIWEYYNILLAFDLDAIGNKIGSTEDLKKCFPDSYQQISRLRIT